MSPNASWNSQRSLYRCSDLGLKSLGKGLFGGSGQRVLHILSLNTLVDVIRVPKERTSGELLPIDINL